MVFTKAQKNISGRSSGDIFDIGNSNCLKGVAIIMLLIHHCFQYPSRYKGQDLTFLIPEHILNTVALSFKICVCLFAFISAYGMTKKMMSIPDSDRRTLHVSVKNIISSRIIKLLGSFIFVFLLVDLFALFYDPARIPEIYGTKFPSCAEYFAADMLGLAELLGTPTFLGTYWYYSLAIVIILIVPAMYLLNKRIGSAAFLALVAVINFTVTFENRNIWHYILCIAVGVVCAAENVITRLVNYKICRNVYWNKIGKFTIEFLLVVVLLMLREGELKGELYPFWDAVIPVVLIPFLCEFIFPIPVIRQIFAFLGIYSANIFMVHNFIRNVWFYDFTYQFRYPVVIVGVLLINSLILSILIELLKKGLHYNQLINWIIRCFHREVTVKEGEG